MWSFSTLNPLTCYRRYRLNSLLAEFSRRAGECETPEDVYRHMESVLSEVVDFNRVVIRLVDLEASTLTDAYVVSEVPHEWDREPTRPLESISLTGTIVSRGQPILISDCRDETLFTKFPSLAVNADRLPSLMGVPLIYRGAVVGVMILRATRPHAFSDRDLEVVKTIASQVTPTAVNSLQMEQLQGEVRERAVMAKISRTVSSSIDFSDVWEQFVHELKILLPFDRVVMALLDEDNETIVDRYVTGVAIPGWDDSPVRSLPSTPASKILGSRTGNIVSSEENDRFSMERLGYRMSERLGLRGSMYAPLIAGDRVVGTLSVRTTQEAYKPEQLELLENIAMQVGGSVSASELYAQTLRLTHERAARIELELKNRQLKDSNEARSRFISAISHELRTPLTSIVAFVDIVRRNKSGNISEKELDYLEVVRRNGQRLKELIDDLLDIATIETDSLRLSAAELSVKEAVEIAIDSTKPMTDVRFQKVVPEYSDESATLYTDRTRFDQILSNLIANASKASRDYAEITIQTSIENDRLEIAVIEQGNGMSKAEAEIAFDEFGRSNDEANKANQGRGLGLPLSRQLARALGGDIELTSKEGEGSIVVLTLPLELRLAA